jgi:predicted nucleic acid-binding protein
MTDSAFFDTNIIVYLFDQSNPLKRKESARLFDYFFKAKRGYLSTQVLSEFFIVTTKKLKLLSEKDAQQLINDFLKTNLIIIDDHVMSTAMKIAISHHLSFWDALIIASASKAKAKLLFTEDLNHGQVINGIQICNPFLLGEKRR